MSAEYDTKTGRIFLVKSLPADQQLLIENLIESAFDYNTDIDEEEIVEAQRTQKTLEKYYIFKLIIFPVEYLLTRTMFGKKEADKITDLAKSFYSSLKKKSCT